MLRYVYGRDDLVADFVVRAKRASGFAPHAGFPPDANLRAIGIVNGDDQLIAGVVYFNWLPAIGTIEMSVEALPRTMLRERWLTPGTLAVMFQYPFMVCRCQMLHTKTADSSTHVKRMLAAMNFSLVRVPRAAGPEEDGIIGVLTVEDWRASKFCKRYGHDIAPAPVEQAEQAA